MKIIIENSTWNNIGDGFYQFSLYYMFKQLFPSYEIAMMEGPITRAFRPSKKYKKNTLNLMEIQFADIYVFSGPILGKNFTTIYGPVIKNILNRGSSYMILSAAGPKSCAEEINKFFSQYPPIAVSTRDEVTYNLFKDSCPNIYNGVCAALLVSKTCPVADIFPEELFITVSFYESLEPKNINYEVNKGALNIDSIQVTKYKKVKNWRIKRHFEWMRKMPVTNNGIRIIRPIHDIAYKFSHLNFAYPSSFVSYNPLSYLSLYKHTKLTVSNRIHAVIPTLSFGNPAVYFGDSFRNKIFDRVGLNSYDNAQVLTLHSETIDDYYNGMCNWLKSIIL